MSTRIYLLLVVIGIPLVACAPALGSFADDFWTRVPRHVRALEESSDDQAGLNEVVGQTELVAAEQPPPVDESRPR